MLVIGLTGGIGAGKSTAARRFEQLGATVIDVDALGHVVLQPGGRAYDAVLEAFGTVDRQALGAIVFRDPAALGRLTAISHPAINEELGERLAALDAEVVVLDMAILSESDLGHGMYTMVVSVEADVEQRVRRAVARGMPEADVRRRIAAQSSEEQRRKLSSFVLVNDGSEADFNRQVDVVWRELAPRAG